MTDDLRAAMGRIEALEREVVRTRRLTGALLLACLLVAAYGFRPGPAAEQEVLAAGSFALVDGSSRTRAQLTLQSDRPVLQFFDPQGRARIVVGLDGSDAGLMVVLNAAGQPKARFPEASP